MQQFVLFIRIITKSASETGRRNNKKRKSIGQNVTFICILQTRQYWSQVPSGEGQILIVIIRLLYNQETRNIEVNGLLVVILVTVAHFLGVLTEKNKKEQKSRKIGKRLFWEFLLNNKHIFIDNCQKKQQIIQKNKICTKFAPSLSFIPKKTQKLAQNQHLM